MLTIKMLALIALPLGVFLHAEASTKTDLTVSPDDSWRTERKCGLNCAYLMLSAFGVDADYKLMSETLPISHDGSSLSAISRTLQEYGLNNSMVRLTPHELSAAQLPVIAHLEPSEISLSSDQPVGHFVLVAHISPRTGVVTYIDGTTAILSERPLSEFSRNWSGAAIVKRPSVWMRIVLPLGVGVMIVVAASVFIRFSRPRPRK